MIDCGTIMIMKTRTIPSQLGTLAKRTRTMLQPNFTKEPFRPTRGLRAITNINGI